MHIIMFTDTEAYHTTEFHLSIHSICKASNTQTCSVLIISSVLHYCSDAA